MAEIKQIKEELAVLKGSMEVTNTTNAAEHAKLDTQAKMLEKFMGTIKEDIDKQIKDLKPADDRPKKSLILAKQMMPTKLIKEENWRKWREDAEDYCDEVFEGMKKMMEKVRYLKDEVKEEDMDGDEWWGKRRTLYRFLRNHTAEEPRKVVDNVKEDNGWEAWRMLQSQCEPSVGVREADVVAQFSYMVAKRVKNVTETRLKLVELDEKAKRVEQVTGKSVDE